MADSKMDFGAVFGGLKQTFTSRRTFCVRWRESQLNRLRTMMVENADAIVEAVQKDLGRPVVECLLGDVGCVVDEVDLALQQLRTWMKPEGVQQPIKLLPGNSQVVKQPKGVVLVIGSWNFPMHVIFMPLVGVIAAGCCAVLKPSEVAPACSALIASLVRRYLDPHCFCVVEGGVEETTALLSLPFNHIVYTGNGSVAKKVMAAAANNLTPVTLELGGKSPVVVDRTANLEVAANRILHGRFFNCGQVCISPDYVLCHRDVEDRLVAQLKATLAKMFGDDPKKSGSFGRIINERHWDRVTSLLQTTKGQVVVGGLGSADRNERYVPPTIVLRPDPNDALMRDEIFGPVLPVIPVDSVDKAVEFVNSRPRPLALYVFGEDRATTARVVHHTFSGGACVNDVMMHATSPYLPFGGVGASGTGAYHGKHGFDEFSHHRPVMERGTWLDPPRRYPPYNASDLPLMKGLLLGGLVPPKLKAAARALKVLAMLGVVAWVVVAVRHHGPRGWLQNRLR